MDCEKYTPQQRRAILDLARMAVTRAVTDQELTTVEDDCSREAVHREAVHREAAHGVFVTLRRRSGELRGCIGTFDPKTSLGESIAEMAAACTHDSRFKHNPVTEDELDDLRFFVRILTPLEPLDDPLDLELGVDGVLIVGERYGKRVRGCFLPEVATEQNWTVPQLLSECCAQKMLLSLDAWRPPTELKFFKFQAVSIGEG